MTRENARMLAAIFVVFALARLARVSLYTLGTPFDVGYESPNVFTIREIQRGINVYSQHLYLQPPFALTIYTPLYHYLVALTPGFTNPFLAGRIISLVFLLACALPVFAISPKRNWHLPAIAFSVFLLFWPVTREASLMRGDTLGVFLSASAVVFVARYPKQTSMLIFAALLCSLAFATKQSFVSAPIACGIYLANRNRREAGIFVAAYTLFIAMFLGLAFAEWGRGFFFSVFPALHHPMTLQLALQRLREFVREFLAIICLLASIGGAATIFSRTFATPSPFPFYLVTSWAIALVSAAKLGGSLNYFVEPILALTLLAVFLEPTIQDFFERHRMSLALPLFVAGCFIVEACQARIEDYSQAVPEVLIRRAAERTSRARAFETLGLYQPRILNLAHATISTELPGDVSLPDPYLYAVLWKTGGLDERSLTHLLDQKYFSAVVTYDVVISTEKDPFRGPRWSHVLSSVQRNYPCRAQFIGGGMILTPNNRCPIPAAVDSPVGMK